MKVTVGKGPQVYRPQRRLDLCTQLKTVHKRLTDNYWSSVGLGEPPDASCKSILSEGGGKCWFSSVFYLLTGNSYERSKDSKSHLFSVVTKVRGCKYLSKQTVTFKPDVHIF